MSAIVFALFDPGRSPLPAHHHHPAAATTTTEAGNATSAAVDAVSTAVSEVLRRAGEEDGLGKEGVRQGGSNAVVYVFRCAFSLSRVSRVGRVADRCVRVELAVCRRSLRSCFVGGWRDT